MSIGSGPIEPGLQAEMNTIAIMLDELFNGNEKPKKVGFVLMVFNFGEEVGRCNYISNAERDHVKTLLREQLAYFEGAPDNVRGTA